LHGEERVGHDALNAVEELVDGRLAVQRDHVQPERAQRPLAAEVLHAF
jgi:hypothetical protein